MQSPELIRQASAEKAGRKPSRPIDEVEREQAEQLQADQIFRGIRRDCESLLSTRGAIKRHPFARYITFFTPFDKGRVLETSILDDEGNPIKLQLFSLNEDPVKSPEINLSIEGLYTFLSFQKDLASIDNFRYAGRGSFARNKRGANLHDARNYREIVDALQSQQ